ncbi:hypothetical protein NKR19_g5148 [Coniochaeta hoffmannii]|uniref:Uncharacterized protein n=1 Tax=Coniochaeta hoffmannii TaxID=91930 RepID=A0AA38VTK8_9PEZI|nr:hypothetical protein NKR19_g5148 [Coniochaeta hoffmannii]
MSSYIKTDKPWNGGHVPTQGVPCPSEATVKFGSGTDDDPHVYWVGDIKSISKKRLNACTDIARKESMARGFRCVVVRQANHDTVFRRDEYGQRVTHRLTGKPESDPADPHITLFLGHSFFDIVLQGHVYVDVDDEQVPVDVMDPEDRKLIHDGKEKVAWEYWGMKGTLGYDEIRVPLHRLSRNQVARDPDAPHPAHGPGPWRRGFNTIVENGGGKNAILRVSLDRNGGAARVDSRAYSGRHALPPHHGNRQSGT